MLRNVHRTPVNDFVEGRGEKSTNQLWLTFKHNKITPNNLFLIEKERKYYASSDRRGFAQLMLL